MAFYTACLAAPPVLLSTNSQYRRLTEVEACMESPWHAHFPLLPLVVHLPLTKPTVGSAVLRGAYHTVGFVNQYGKQTPTGVHLP